jgi:hypothetical protein
VLYYKSYVIKVILQKLYIKNSLQIILSIRPSSRVFLHPNKSSTTQQLRNPSLEVETKKVEIEATTLSQLKHVYWAQLYVMSQYKKIVTSSCDCLFLDLFVMRFGFSKGKSGSSDICAEIN